MRRKGLSTVDPLLGAERPTKTVPNEISVLATVERHRHRSVPNDFSVLATVGENPLPETSALSAPP